MKILKWSAIVILILVVVGFLGFLYLIPPFTLAGPEEFSKPTAEKPPSMSGIEDPTVRVIAEHGRYVALIHDCAGCHTAQGDEGPNWNKYLAGGAKYRAKWRGTIVSANITPDPETGIGRLTDDQIKRAIRSGIYHTGRIIEHRDMPWASWSNMSDEDLYALIVYLRHIPPVKNRIPEPTTETEIEDPAAIEQFWGEDYSVPDTAK